jgi:hypothetical protein
VAIAVGVPAGTKEAHPLEPDRIAFAGEASFSQNSVSFGKSFRKSGLRPAFSPTSKVAFPKTEVLGKPQDGRIFKHKGNLNDQKVNADPLISKLTFRNIRVIILY